PNFSINGPATLHVVVTTAPADASVQQTTLVAGDNVSWVFPADASQTGAITPALNLTSGDPQPVSVSWDGATVTLTAQDGFVPRGTGRAEAFFDLPFTDPACTPLPDQPSAVTCVVPGVPPTQLQISTVPIAPTEIPALAYHDRNGDGTLTLSANGPDPAPGGEAVAVALDQNGTTLSGVGVLRPGGGGVPGGFSFQTVFTLTDQNGSSYLYEGTLLAGSDGFAGQGYLLGLDSPHVTGAWQAGDPATAATVPTYQVGLSYSTAQPGTPGYGFPGLSLPILADSLIGYDPPGSGPHTVSPPVIGKAGQPLGLQAITTAPLVGQRMTFGFDFGDGAMSANGPDQTVQHTYAMAGDYTVVGYVTDESGVATFGATRIHIDP
ncbi:MAG: PKD domain-containing protein, partial [Dehalococcoidia bacterium]